MVSLLAKQSVIMLDKLEINTDLRKLCYLKGRLDLIRELVGDSSISQHDLILELMRGFELPKEDVCKELEIELMREMSIEKFLEFINDDTELLNKYNIYQK
jgi:hypothetical protein